MTARIIAGSGFVVLVALQMSLATAIPAIQQWFHFVLSVSVYLLVVLSRDQALVWAVVGGLLLDSTRTTPYGTETVALFGSVLITSLIFKQYFTNKSTASLLVVGAVAASSYQLLSLAWILVWQITDPSIAYLISPHLNPLQLLWFSVATTGTTLALAMLTGLVYPPLALHRRLPAH